MKRATGWRGVGGYLATCLLVVSAGVSFAGELRTHDGPDTAHPWEIDRDAIVELNSVRAWHKAKALGGPTFAGSPAWRTHMEFVEQALRRRGVVELRRDAWAYTRWFVDDDRAGGDWALSLEREALPVASYRAYSGATPPEGITAPLVLYDRKSPAPLAGRIVVFDIPELPDPLPAMFAPPGHVFATEDLADLDWSFATRHWYQVNYPTRFGRFGDLLRNSAAAGGLVILDMGAARADGLYTFPLLEAGELGVPMLYLDRDTGARVRDAAKAGAIATLALHARREQAETWFLSGVLPGRHHGTPADEFVLLVTHTDGPNLTQENGALGILAIVDYFARLPRAERDRSLLVVLDPQHYMPGRHRMNWYERHPDMTARIVASVGVEQLGQRAYVERGNDFIQTGDAERSVVFSQDNAQLIAWAMHAIQASSMPRTELRVPARKGQGRWMGLGDVAVERGWPGYGLNTEMSAYWSTAPGLESFDADLFRRQVTLLTMLTHALASADITAVAPIESAP